MASDRALSDDPRITVGSETARTGSARAALVTEGPNKLPLSNFRSVAWRPVPHQKGGGWSSLAMRSARRSCFRVMRAALGCRLSAIR